MKKKRSLMNGTRLIVVSFMVDAKKINKLKIYLQVNREARPTTRQNTLLTVTIVIYTCVWERISFLKYFQHGAVVFSSERFLMFFFLKLKMLMRGVENEDSWRRY